MFDKISEVVIGLLKGIYGLSASVVSGVINTVVSGVMIVRQATGTAGTDETQFSHDGTRSIIKNMNAVGGGTGNANIAMYGNDGAQTFISVHTVAAYGSSGVPRFLISDAVDGGGNGQSQLTGSALTFRSANTIDWSSTATIAGSPDVGLSRNAAGILKVTNGSTGQGQLWTDGLLQGGTVAAATSSRRIILKKTGIADNTATSVITVTVPNANHAAIIKLTLMSSNGSTDAFESTRCAEGLVVLARTTGANVVPAVAALDLAQIATVAAGATHTLAYGVSAVTGAVGASNTFDIQVTIDDSGNTGSNQVVVLAELINSEATGVTMAAA